jgi:hypothetical protein
MLNLKELKFEAEIRSLFTTHKYTKGKIYIVYLDNDGPYIYDDHDCSRNLHRYAVNGCIPEFELVKKDEMNYKIRLLDKNINEILFFKLEINKDTLPDKVKYDNKIFKKYDTSFTTITYIPYVDEDIVDVKTLMP